MKTQDESNVAGGRGETTPKTPLPLPVRVIVGAFYVLVVAPVGIVGGILTLVCAASIILAVLAAILTLLNSLFGGTGGPWEMGYLGPDLLLAVVGA